MLQSRPHRSWGDTNSVRVLRVRDLPRKQIRTETSAHFRLCRTAPQRREPAGVIHVSSLWGRVRLWGVLRYDDLGIGRRVRQRIGRLSARNPGKFGQGCGCFL